MDSDEGAAADGSEAEDGGEPGESRFDAELRRLLADEDALTEQLIEEECRELTSLQRHVETFAPRCAIAARRRSPPRARSSRVGATRA
jgi:hypothetical protein